jgi:hypothetical protein
MIIYHIFIFLLCQLSGFASHKCRHHTPYIPDVTEITHPRTDMTHPRTSSHGIQGNCASPRAITSPHLACIVVCGMHAYVAHRKDMFTRVSSPWPSWCTQKKSRKKCSHGWFSSAERLVPTPSPDADSQNQCPSTCPV